MSLFANFDEGMHFPSCKFYRKKCQDESTQFKTRLQFGRACQPVKTNPWLGVRWKLASIAVCALLAQRSHVEAKKCYGSKIYKDKLIKVTIGLAEPMREGNMIRCLLMSQWAGRVTMWFERVQGGSKVILTQFRIQRHNPLVEDQRKHVITTKLSRIRSKR
jgi:hypothetical protein